MAVTVRPVNLDVEEEELLSVLERNLGDLPHRRRFKWMYRDNPLGLAWSWFACDGGSGRIVGVASVFRRAMWIGPRVILCGQVGDFAIDASHRSLGPALMLQRATFEPVDRGPLAFCYDCPPHERGMSTFHRLGMSASTTMTRYARLLRSDRQIASRLGKGPIGASVTPLANVALRLVDAGRSRPPGLEVSVHEGPFGEEFSDLDRRVSARDVIRSRRMAEDLNWRYRDDPLHGYVVLTARRRGELQGFAVLALTGRDAFIVDLFGDLLPPDASALLESSVDHVKQTIVETVHVPLSNMSEMAATVKRARFRARDRGPHVVVYVAETGDIRALFERRLPWDLTYSDVVA
jgi:hypothetical protein